MQQESPITPERRAEKLLLSEMTFNIPVAPEQERPVTQIYSDIDAEDLQNTRELLELVSGRSTEISPKKGNSLNFRLSEYVELLKEGKVLVRTPGTFTPSRDLYDIPFERKIHEALEREGIRQPKILQSYVWKAMLDLSHVAFVAGSKTGKTIGNILFLMS